MILFSECTRHFENVFKGIAFGSGQMVPYGSCHAVQEFVVGTQNCRLQHTFSADFIRIPCADGERIGEPSQEFGFLIA